jgi:DNA-binding transcriptional ArsR family regulator
MAKRPPNAIARAHSIRPRVAADVNLDNVSDTCNIFITCVGFVDALGGRSDVKVSGDDLVKILNALGNVHRLRIMAALVPGRNYVSQLARELQISRPLLHLHLQRLEAAGLIRGTLELSPDGKAMKFFEVAPFSIELNPASIVEASTTLSFDQKEEEK